MYNPKLRRRLARVQVPALVVWGENDPIMDLDYGQAYAQSLASARFALIPQIDQPERLVALVKEFMKGLPR